MKLRVDKVKIISNGFFISNKVKTVLNLFNAGNISNLI